jgi:hypothetical protein
MEGNNILKNTFKKNKFELSKISKILGEDKISSYIDRNDWKEEIICENNLEKELKIFRDEIASEQEDFEKNLSLSNEYDIYNSHDTSYVNYRIKGAMAIHHTFISFFFSSSGLSNKDNIDIISDIYLEINFGSKSFIDLSINELYALFEMSVSFNSGFGGEYNIEYNSLISCMVNQLFYGKSIKYCDHNIIQIPLFSFNTYIHKFSKPPYPKGVPIYDKWYVLLRDVPYEENYSFSLIINGMTMRNQIVQMCNFLSVYTSPRHKTVIRPIYQFDLSAFRHLTKYICIYFNPRDDDYSDESYPQIYSIRLFSDVSSPITLLELDAEDLLTIEVFGITIYLIPLCKEFSSWERIYKVFENPLKNLSSQGINLDLIDKLSLEVSVANPSDNYFTNFFATSLYVDNYIDI